MKYRAFGIASAIAIAATAMAGPHSAAIAAAPKKAEAGTLAADIQIPRAAAGKGQVVFYRKGGLQGSAVACSVHENGQKVSSLGGGRYFIYSGDPGRHEFKVESEAKDILALELEADETQFATCNIKMGLMVGRPDIRPATEAEFRGMKKFKMVDADDMGPGAGALRPDEVAAALSAPAAAPAEAPTAAEAPAAEPAAPAQ